MVRERRKLPAKTKSVEALFKQYCAKDEVFINGRCEKIEIRPKDKQIIHHELSVCAVEMPKVDPIEERAKQMLLKHVFKERDTRERYIELAGPSREEIQTVTR